MILEKKSEINNILVLRFSSLGDVILASSVFPCLKKEFPNGQITFITRNAYKDLFTNNPYVDKIYKLEDGFSLDDHIFSQKWDTVIDLQNNKKSKALVKKLKGNPVIRTFQKEHLKRLQLLLLRNKNVVVESVISRYLQTATGRDKNDFNPAKLFKAKECFITTNKLNSLGIDTDKPLLALFPFAAWLNKVWPSANYIDVATYFINKGYGVLIFGSKSEYDQALQLKNKIGARAFCLAGEFSLSELIEVISLCSLALGGDTGLSHLARACGVKTGMIFGPTVRQFGFFPEGEPAFEVFEASQWCRPCHAHGGNFCFTGKRNCMNKIVPSEVIFKLEELLTKEVSVCI